MLTTIQVSLDVPKDYQLDTLTKQLTEYAKGLVAKTRSKTNASKTTRKQYAHDILCGIVPNKQTDEKLLDDYLKDKYEV